MMPDFANTRRRVQRIVTECWMEVLQQPVIGANDNFFDLGGTSLHAILLHEKLQTRLPAPDLALLTIFQHPTVSAFLAALYPEAEAPTPASPARSFGMASRSETTGSGMSVKERALRQQQALGKSALGNRSRHS